MIEKPQIGQRVILNRSGIYKVYASLSPDLETLMKTQPKTIKALKNANVKDFRPGEAPTVYVETEDPIWNSHRITNINLDLASEVNQSKNRPVNFSILTKTPEECGELIQALAKLDTWGPDGHYDDGTTNLERVEQEMCDVQACISFLSVQYSIGYGPACEARVRDKLSLFKELSERSKVSQVNTVVVSKEAILHYLSTPEGEKFVMETIRKSRILKPVN